MYDLLRWNISKRAQWDGRNGLMSWSLCLYGKPGFSSWCSNPHWVCQSTSNISIIIIIIIIINNNNNNTYSRVISMQYYNSIVTFHISSIINRVLGTYFLRIGVVVERSFLLQCYSLLSWNNKPAVFFHKFDIHGVGNTVISMLSDFNS